MTRAQYIALVWRVQELSVDFSVTFTNFTDDPEAEDPTAPGDTETVAATHTIVRYNDTVIDNGPIKQTAAIVGNMGGLLTWRMTANNFAQFAFDVATGVFQDEDDKIWVACGMAAKKDDSSFISIHNATEAAAEAPGVNFTGKIIILGEEVDFPMEFIEAVHSVGSTVCTITPTKFFPYKNSTGSAAWDATTGAPINGGPGA